MSLNTLETAYANGEVIDASHINELTLSLLGQFVGRDPNGVPTPNQSLGTLALPWGNLYATGVILNGLALDTSLITSLPNRVVSGQTRALSSMPDFIRANGAALEFDILGSTNDLVLSINNTAVSISSDITKTGVVAAPSTNNAADINDTTIVNSLYAGEEDSENPEITIDAVGSEVSALVGQIVAFKTPTGEIFQGLLKTATKITNVFRGFYFDDSGAAINRGVLSNNDTITLMSIGWVFVEDNGTTVDVATLTPSISYNAPSSPSTGQYWFDITNQVWKRYSGTSFDIINRILIGQVISDDTNTIASRSWDFSNNFNEINNVEVAVDTSEIIKTVNQDNRCHVYGTQVEVDLSKFTWNITTDLESPLVESSSTDYYLYISDQGQEVISNKKPYIRKDLKGYYHPHHSWRCVGICYNDASSDFVMSSFVPYNSEIESQTVILSDQKSSGMDGGTFTSGVYQTRDLNTLEEDDEITNLDANQFMLLGGATHEIDARCPVRGTVNTHKSRVFNFDDSVLALQGSSAFAGAADDANDSTIKGSIIKDKSKTYELQHRCQTSRSGQGFGIGSSYGDNEVYSVIKITRRR